MPGFTFTGHNIPEVPMHHRSYRKYLGGMASPCDMDFGAMQGRDISPLVLGFWQFFPSAFHHQFHIVPGDPKYLPPLKTWLEL